MSSKHKLPINSHERLKQKLKYTKWKLGSEADENPILGYRAINTPVGVVPQNQAQLTKQ